MPRAAILLFVHNSADTIAWWIAHHAAVGFSTFLICDDHSTDGTWDVLTNAATFHDIRLTRPDRSLDTRAARETRAMAALHRAACDEFDWTLTLAADEYFQPGSQPLHAILQQNEGKETIAVNWCLFGTDGQPDSGGFSPLAAYGTRAAEDFPDHRVTRSLVSRNAAMSSPPDPFGHIRQAPNWSQAHIRHYAAADLKRRARAGLTAGEAGLTAETIAHFDQNTVTTTIPDEIARSGLLMASEIGVQCLTDLHWRITRALNPLNGHALSEVARTHAPDTVTSHARHAPWTSVTFHVPLHAQSGARLMLNTQSAQLEPLGTGPRQRPVILAQDTQTGHALLFTETTPDESPIALPNCPTILRAIPLKRLSDGTLVSPVNNRRAALSPETTRFEPIDATESLTRELDFLTTLMRGGNTLSSLLASTQKQSVANPLALAAAIAFLPVEDARSLDMFFPGLIPAMVFPSRCSA